jgi:hypothetical protein
MMKKVFLLLISTSISQVMPAGQLAGSLAKYIFSPSTETFSDVNFPQNKSKINGRVVESISQQGLLFANIAFVDPASIRL